MKQLFTILFVAACFLAKAQINYNQYYAYPIYLIQTYAFEIKDSGKVSEARLIAIGRKETTMEIRKFDEKGNLIEYYSGKTKDSIEKKAIFIYDDKNRMKSAKLFRKHKLNEVYNYDFNEQNKITHLLRNERDGEVLQNRTWKYNQTGNLEEQVISKWKSMDTLSVWKYEYYAKDKMAHTYYYRKGKLKREWDYQCKEEGEEIKRKNFFKICKWEESSKDTLTAIYQTTDHKGRITKSISKYTVEDTLVLSRKDYNYKNELTTEWTYDKSFNRQLSYVHYKKGKPKYEWYATYSGDKKTSQTGKSKGKIFSKTIYSYDDAGRITEIDYTGSKAKYHSTTKIEYILRN